MNILNIIIVPQEYQSANHKGLWHKLADELNGETLILDIPADYIITKLNKKEFRIQEAQLGKRAIKKNLSLLRPLFLIRPEILPRIFNDLVARRLLMIIKKSYPDIQNTNINIISYSGKWIDTLSTLSGNLKFYYFILDEVKYFAHNSKSNKQAQFYDKLGCEKSDFIFTMTDRIRDDRKKNNNNVCTIGNGSEYALNISSLKISKMVGFIGNFRSWIDLDLFKNLIKMRRDIIFGIVGPVEKNMEKELKEILNNNLNTAYFGHCDKEDVHKYYNLFSVVIVPYLQNEFMMSTRPIKIVESVFAGTPVVTIPMDGYNECEFIKFGKTSNEFSSAIDHLLDNPIDIESSEYKTFISSNTWSTKANLIAIEVNNGNVRR